MKIRAMILMVGTLALLMTGMVAIGPGFGGATAPPPQQDNSGRWGLLGLLGLAGLAGLLKRPQTEVRTIETQRVVQPRVEPPRERTR